MAGPFSQQIVREIAIATGSSTSNIHNGQQWHTRLEAGYVYYITGAYIHPNTDVAAQTTNANKWYLYDEDGNTICSLAAGAAQSASGTTFASFSSQYREINCSDAAETIYVGCTQSGTGVAPPEGITVVIEAAVRPEI